jgi:hypothetical protein
MTSDGPEFNFSDGRSWKRVRRDTILNVTIALPLLAVVAAVPAIVIKATGLLFSLLPWSFDPKERALQLVQANTFFAAAFEAAESILTSAKEIPSVSYALSLLPSMFTSAIVFLALIFLFYHLMLIDLLVAEIVTLQKVTPPDNAHQSTKRA